jgi:V-type H+-transporting ATPase subunit F
MYAAAEYMTDEQIANDIRHLLRDYTKTIPTVLEIPSKDQPYDPEQDYIMQRVNMMLGGPV